MVICHAIWQRLIWIKVSDISHPEMKLAYGNLS